MFNYHYNTSSVYCQLYRKTWGKFGSLTAGRVLVLIQVAALCAARQAHACGQINRCNTEKPSTDRCEVAAEPLGEPSHFPVGASFIFIA